VSGDSRGFGGDEIVIRWCPFAGNLRNGKLHVTEFGADPYKAVVISGEAE